LRRKHGSSTAETTKIRPGTGGSGARHGSGVISPPSGIIPGTTNSDRTNRMRRNPSLFRLTANVALAALLWDSVLPAFVLAQPAPPPLPQPYQVQPTQPQGDPPSRVGRIAATSGTVSFHNEGDSQWSRASVNYPVSSGNAFWTEPAAEAQLEIAANRIVMAGTTEFDIATLDVNGIQAVAAQGEVYIHLNELAANEAWTIQTPRGLVRLEGIGRYGIVVGNTEQPTLVTAIDGSAQVDGPGVSLHVGGGETASIGGTDTFEGSVGPIRNDAFLSARQDAERRRPAPTAPTTAAPMPTVQAPPVRIPPQVAAMPGGSDLNQYGDWSEAPDYGRVWYPPVAQGWVPYRHGHWAYVAPWGWTWIDDAPWGFAPFHYGRWIEIGGRWAWTPGGYAVAAPPVYAPALVTFIGIGAGVALGAALASGSIGWVPLGPREPFRPWYRASDRYTREVNIQHVTNINNNISNVTINNYVNRGAATAIPSAAMVASRPVQSVAQPVSAQQFAAARPFVGQQPVRPTAATAGVTPAVARQMNLGPAAGFRPAPGPVVHVQAPGPAVVRTASPGAAAARPAVPGAPVAGAVVPGTAVPGAVPGAATGAATGAAPARPAVPRTPVTGAAVPGTAAPGAVAPGARIPATAVPQVMAPGAAVRGAVLPGSAPNQFARPMVATPGQVQPGGPPAASGNPAVQPNRPAATTQPPASSTANSGAISAPQYGRPTQAAPTIVRPGEPRPMPGANASFAHPGQPAPPVHSDMRPLPQVIAPSRPEAPHIAAPTPRPEPQQFAPAAPPTHVATPNIVHAEPPHFAPQPMTMRPAPPPPPRAAAPAPAPQAPAAHQKRPGER
jgi:hypothetical protein